MLTINLLSPLLEFGFMRRALVGCIALTHSATPRGYSTEAEASSKQVAALIRQIKQEKE